MQLQLRNVQYTHFGLFNNAKRWLTCLSGLSSLYQELNNHNNSLELCSVQCYQKLAWMIEEKLNERLEGRLNNFNLNFDKEDRQPVSPCLLMIVMFSSSRPTTCKSRQDRPSEMPSNFSEITENFSLKIYYVGLMLFGELSLCQPSQSYSLASELHWPQCSSLP